MIRFIRSFYQHIFLVHLNLKKYNRGTKYKSEYDLREK